MPEGDTLHILAKALAPRLQGQYIRLTHLRGVPGNGQLPAICEWSAGYRWVRGLPGRDGHV